MHTTLFNGYGTEIAEALIEHGADMDAKTKVITFSDELGLKMRLNNV